MREAIITGAARTPVGCFGGTLKDTGAVELGALVIAAAVKRAGISPAEVDEVIMGNVLQAGLGQNPARQAAMRAGIPREVPALTINKVCGSGLKAVTLAAWAIAAGEADVVVAGGMENMSQAPYLLKNARWGYRMGNGDLVDGMIHDGLWDAFNDFHMALAAEFLAEKYVISRREQDAFALESQLKTKTAQEEGRFREEIVPVTVPRRKGEPLLFDSDEFPRPDTTLEKLAGLKPVFKKEGTITAGNASGINDGAAAVVLVSPEKAKELKIKEPLGRIAACSSAGVDPLLMGLGPLAAVSKALAKAKLNLEEIDLIESNEAFDVQSLVLARELGWDTRRVNVNGGAIALGHPIGASGARVLVTLLYEMKRRRCGRGLATLCIGGGMGIAAIVESLGSDLDIRH